jgi:hypothetical protein
MWNPNRKVVGLVSGLAFVLTATTAFAYVLPTYSILRRMVERRDEQRLGTLAVSGTAHLLPAYAREAGAALGIHGDRQISAEATAYLKLPGRCRIELEVPEGARSAAMMAHGKRRSEGASLAALDQVISQICPLLALRSSSEGEGRASVERHLASLGVNTKVTRLARYDGKIAYVMGARGPDAAQFWVYKDSFQPARIVYSQDGRRWEVRFRNFGSPVTGDAFPRIIELVRGGDTVFRFTALQSEAGVPVADALF